jgi:hypothetical protein
MTDLSSNKASLRIENAVRSQLPDLLSHQSKRERLPLKKSQRTKRWKKNSPTATVVIVKALWYKWTAMRVVKLIRQ